MSVVTVCARCRSALPIINLPPWLSTLYPRHQASTLSRILLVPSTNHSQQPHHRLQPLPQQQPHHNVCREVHKRAQTKTTDVAENDELKLKLSKFIRKDNLKWRKSPWKVKQLRYTRHIMNLIKKGKVEEAREVFVSMKEGKVRAEAVVYNTLIAGYGRQGDIQSAFRVFNDVSYSTKHQQVCTLKWSGYLSLSLSR